MRNALLMSLADVAQLVQYGYTASASDTNIGPKFLRITDIVPPHIDWNSVPYCEIDEKDLSKFSLEQDDIVIARTGATVGYAKLIRNHEPSVFASYLVRIRVDPEKADPRYVGRIIESDVYKRFVLSRVGGAAQPNANARVLTSFRLPIPERHAQTRIATILSAYDDLIENNRRRIALLEEAARLLYREWFVQYRFPGREHIKIIDGRPEGWERRYLGDVVTTQYGHTAERGVAAMAHQPGAGLYQPFVEAGERPALDLLGRRQRPQEVRQIVGKSVKAETSGVCREAHAGEPRPFERILALLDVLLGCAPVVVEGQHPFIGQAAIGDDETNGRKQLARMEFHLGHNTPRLRPALRPVLEAGVVTHEMVRWPAGAAPGQKRDLLVEL